MVGRFTSSLFFAGCGVLCDTSSLSAANIQKELERPVPTCYTTTYNAIRLLPGFFESGKIKDIESTIREWDKFCDPAKFEPLLRARIISDLLVLREPTIHENEVEAFLRYQDWKGRFNSGERIDPMYRDYYDFTVRFAKSRIGKNETKVHPLWYYYAEEFEKFHQETKRNIALPIARALEARRSELRTRTVLPLGLYAGVWQPVGRNSLLGTHPLFGTFIGWGNYYWEIVANIHFKFLESANEITTIHKDQLVTTRHFFGGYIGLDITYNWVTTRHYDIGTTFGVAFDGFDVVKSSSSGANDGKSINGLNLNLGGKFRYYLSIERSHYLFISGHYNFLNYENSGGTDLSGGALTFFAGYGSAFSLPRAKAVREIGGL